MNRNIFKFAGVSLFALAAGCGGDPIIGRWKADFRASLGAGAAFVASADLVVEFRGDHTTGFSVETVVLPTSPQNPNCRSLIIFAGITWTTSQSGAVSTLNLSASTGATESRMNCTNPNDNRATAPAMNASLMGSMSTYSISGNMLVINSMNGTSSTLTRQ